MMILILALIAWLAGATAAHASPLLVPILTAVGFSAGAAAIIAPIAIAAVSIGVSLLLKPKSQTAKDAGVELTIRADPLVPQSLIVGRAVLAGSRIAPPWAYGKRGDTDNSDMIEMIALADHPCAGLVKAFAEGQEVTFDAPTTITAHADLQPFSFLLAFFRAWFAPLAGVSLPDPLPMSWADFIQALTDASIPTATVDEALAARDLTIQEYNKKIALAFFDGSQTAADAFAVSVLADHPERPWTANHKGLGRTYARLHYVYDRENVTGPLNWKFVVDGIRLYDPRQDDTVGGSGDQRFDDLSTHVFTRNLAVICYNILRGIRVADASGELKHFYGLQDTPAENLPLDIWFAAMNEADAVIALSGGASEPQFWGGREIAVSEQPIEVVRDILKATGGQFVENGGIYKLYLGAPGLPAFAFDDGSIVARQADTAEPIRPLADRTTYITGNFISPDDGWIQKPAPPRIDSDLEAVQRRVESGLDAVMVQSPTHMQRVMQQILRRARRERRHTLSLPPAFFGVEPGDVGEWPSVVNGYVAGDGSGKLFAVESADIDVNLITTVSLLEVDPADYDWSTTNEIAQPVGSLVQSRPAAKIIDGFDAEGAAETGDHGAERPIIRVTWTPPEDDDLTALVISIRQPAAPLDITTIIVDGFEIASGQAIIRAMVSPLTDYQVRGQWRSDAGWATEATLWKTITTPDTRLSDAELSARAQALMQQLDQSTEAALKPTMDAIDARLAALGQTVAGILAMVNERIDGPGENSIVTYLGNTNANVTEVKTVTDALAVVFLQAFAGNAFAAANALLQLQAGVAPGGGGASLALAVRSTAGDLMKTAGFKLWAAADADGGASGWVLTGDQGQIELPDGSFLDALMLVAQNEPATVPITTEGGTSVIRPDLSGRKSQFKATLTGDAQVRAPTGITSMAFDLQVKWGGAGYALTFSDEFTLPKPTGFSTAAGVTNYFACRVRNTNPIRIRASYDGYSVDSPILSARDQVARNGVDGNKASYTATIDLLSGTPLDFVPGNLLIATIVEVIESTSTSGTTYTSDLAVADWNDLGSVEITDGSLHRDPLRIRALWKIATGAETTLSPVGASASYINEWSWAAVVSAYDVLGGSIAAAAATVQAARSGTLSQTIAASGAPGAAPAVPFAFGGQARALPASLNWSAAPDVVKSSQYGSGWTGGLFNSETLAALADRTVSLAAGTRQTGLISGYFYFES